MSTTTEACFGFYVGQESAACPSCAVQRRCRAILLTHGCDILGDLVDHLLAELPDSQYRDTDRVSELTRQLKNPPPPSLPEEETAPVQEAAAEPDIEI